MKPRDGTLARVAVVAAGLAAGSALAPMAAPVGRGASRRLRVATRAVLTVGTPLRWEESLDQIAYVRAHGIDQFLAMWRRSEARERDDELLWGDELEYAILKVDADRARVCLRGPEIRDWLRAREAAHAHRTEGCEWHPEYGSWMLEGTPRRPYSGSLPPESFFFRGPFGPMPQKTHLSTRPREEARCGSVDAGKKGTRRTWSASSGTCGCGGGGSCRLCARTRSARRW